MTLSLIQKQLPWVLYKIKLQVKTFSENSLWLRCFSVNSAKFLRKVFIETFGATTSDS